jgi:hypothetical protein
VSGIIFSGVYIVYNFSFPPILSSILKIVGLFSVVIVTPMASFFLLVGIYFRRKYSKNFQQIENGKEKVSSLMSSTILCAVNLIVAGFALLFGTLFLREHALIEQSLYHVIEFVFILTFLYFLKEPTAPKSELQVNSPDEIMENTISLYDQ